MGGDTILFPASISDEEDEINIKQQSRDHFDEHEARMKSVYKQVFKNYYESKNRSVNMELAKSKILSYTPGSWVENVGGTTINDYEVPKTTTLLLIGPKGSGKSSLINRISKVFEDDKFAPERAQVTYNSSISDGTSSLHEYMIPRTSTSFCLYDTCSLSDDLSENLGMIMRWMTKGVCHGESVKSLNSRMKSNTRQDILYERRTVNFVIFVVNGLSVLKCMDSIGMDTQYTQMVAELFSSPFLSFKDHKPAIAITHGDLLSLSERARVRVYLGELWGVHPSTQTFDVPDDSEPTTELTVVDLIRYGLEHADRNLPCKVRPTISKGSTIQPWSYLLLLFSLGMFISTLHLQRFHSKKLHPENVPEPNPEMKKVMEVGPKIIPEPMPEIKKIMEVHLENVPGSSPEIKEILPEKTPRPSIEIKKVHTEWISPEVNEVLPKKNPRPGIQIKKVQTGRISPEVKKVLPEKNPRPSIEIKKVQAERISEKSRKIKKVRVGRRVTEPMMKIDWKKIRHIW